MAFWRSTLGKKVVMAVTGFVMVGWATGHMLGNLLIFGGAEKINAYAAFLRSTGELLWAVRLLLLACVVLHITAAVQLTAIDRVARPVGYVKHDYRAATFASRTIRWGGVLLLVFVVFHLLHMTFGTIHPGFIDGQVYHNLTVGLAVPWVAGFYIVSMIALGLHLYHGTWSGFRTLGINRPTDKPLRRHAVTVFAVLLAAGFAAIPLAVLLGLVRRG